MAGPLHREGHQVNRSPVDRKVIVRKHPGPGGSDTHGTGTGQDAHGSRTDEQRHAELAERAAATIAAWPKGTNLESMGWVRAESNDGISEGDTIVVFQQGRWRTALVTETTKTNVKYIWVTPASLKELDEHWGRYLEEAAHDYVEQERTRSEEWAARQIAGREQDIRDIEALRLVPTYPHPPSEYDRLAVGEWMANYGKPLGVSPGQARQAWKRYENVYGYEHTSRLVPWEARHTHIPDGPPSEERRAARIADLRRYIDSIPGEVANDVKRATEAHEKALRVVAAGRYAVLTFWGPQSANPAKKPVYRRVP